MGWAHTLMLRNARVTHVHWSSRRCETPRLAALLLLGACTIPDQSETVPAYRPDDAAIVSDALSEFDALSAAEITLAVAVAKGADSRSNDLRIVSVTLEEPLKRAVLNAQATGRTARVVTYSARDDALFETLVDVREKQLRSTRQVIGQQPWLGMADSRSADAIVSRDARWKAALARRGITNANSVVGGGWSAGYFGDSTETGRIVRVVPYLREGRNDRIFFRPIEGIMATVNLIRDTVTAFIDEAVVPVSPVRNVRADVTTPEIVRNEVRSAGIVVRGGTVQWRNWTLHVAPNPREGVVLHRVSFRDGARERSVLYRASGSEMVVPYGDPDRGWFVRNALDAGELGLGRFVIPLREGVDVPHGALFLPAVMADESGVPVEKPRAIALYERDAGLSWRYMDVARRARELVVEWISTVGNYEYAFAWMFHEDGSITQRTSLTGIMSVKGSLAPDSVNGGRQESRDANGAPVHGERLSNVLVAPHHQHFFVFRLDTDVDGAAGQTVLEVEGRATGEGDVHASHAAMTAAVDTLRTELGARRFASGNSARRWVVQNSTVGVDGPENTGLSLMPGENAVALADSASWIRKRAGFLDAQLWVTPYRDGELYAAGEYPNQSRGGDGLPMFTRGDASVQNTDVVLWYVMGITHLPRREDWPVMPSHVAGFRLVPTGFFKANPLLRVDSVR